MSTRCALLCLVLLTGCSSTVSPAWWQDAGKNWCTTVKTKPDLYSAETSSTCYRDGQVVDIPTNHTDLSMIAMITVGLGTVAAAVIPILAVK